ncbi:Uncharacterised protein [Brevibacterium casei]|uniref:Uncharacterized protein n=1 Tax=Brevibacterium casei TaxID=33889 RepID=A0A449D7D1_9MICO|nr:hypothetical protein [Brevibacterium casei]VEW13539.1 Uncharacterised protein [Brevibacterium casei]
MTDTVKSWIEERRAIHSEGTGVLLRNPYELNREYDLWDEDAEAIADAHNMFPRALDALNKVLELHKPIFYYEHEDSCMNTDEDHCAERHVEFDLGEYYCEDLPTGEEACDSCYDDEGERVAYPCATVRAIEGAIND